MLLKTKIEIKKWLNHYGVKSYELIEDEEYGYVVNVDNNNVYLDNLGLQNIGVKFSKVDGHFYCNNNQLKSLLGCPEIVNGDFVCHNNKLTSLEECPKIVKKSFYCNNNQLNNLESLKNLLNIEIKNNYIYLIENPELGKLQNITDFNEFKKILKIYQEQNVLNLLITNNDDKIINKIIKV